MNKGANGTQNRAQKDLSNAGSKSNPCPRCGGQMVATRKQVVAKYPSPALEKFVCEKSDCNHVKYVSLDSDSTGFDGDQRGGASEK